MSSTTKMTRQTFLQNKRLDVVWHQNLNLLFSTYCVCFWYKNEKQSQQTTQCVIMTSDYLQRADEERSARRIQQQATYRA